MRRLLAVLITLGLTVTLAPTASAADRPKPGSLAYLVQDVQLMTEAYGRITGPSGQLRNPAYLPALVAQGATVSVSQLLTMAATPTRLSLTGAVLVPGWNAGNPLRAGWDGTRGVQTPVAFTNRYGALLRGTLYSPLPDATDPYSGEPLSGPFPGVVLTPGSVQGSANMYQWLAQDLAERGYLVLVYDVQGQGMSETLPHESGSDLPFCFPLAPPKDLELLGCPGVPFQQPANFVHGTVDATDFFYSTPQDPYPNPGKASAAVDDFNPLWEQFDRRPLERPTADGRTDRFAIIGHSLGAAAVSKVQGDDPRVSTVVALDKLQQTAAVGPMDVGEVVPTVPALGIQSVYGFTVSPYVLAGGSIVPGPVSPTEGPDPARERATGFDAWVAAGLDSMVVVPRASTHLEYTDIPLVLPASRYGQALSSVYTQAWLDHWLKGAPVTPLLADSWTYLEPTRHGVWSPVTLRRAELLSLRFCSAYSLDGHVDPDITDAGCSG